MQLLIPFYVLRNESETENNSFKNIYTSQIDLLIVPFNMS